MVSNAAEAAQEYKLTLDELVNNNKMQINLLTILAEDYQSYPGAIVETIEKQVYTVPNERKLPILYVIDSILKNVQGDQYKECFQKIIIKIFLHVFVHGDERARASLYRLRVTWAPLFPASTLYKLDMKVNSEDSNWPIVNPKTAATSASGSVKAPASASSSSSHVHINPKFLNNQTANGVRDPRSAARAALAPAAAPAPAIAPPAPKETKAPVIQKNTNNNNSVRPHPETPRDPLDLILGAVDPRVKIEVEDPIPSVAKKASPPKRRPEQVDMKPPLMPSEPKKQKRNHQVPRDEDLRQHKKGVGKPKANRLSPSGPPGPKPSATNLPGSHAFAVAPMPVPNASPSFIDYPQAPIPMGGVASLPPPGVFVPPPQANPTYFAPGEASKNMVISHEIQPKLEGIPANNRIFVDGKAHEVIYLDETAVIQRNGLPHRIYFSGPPRNVIIDGVAYLLHFGESKTVYIDQQPHIIRFGSPSKELYMGTYAFKGQFGGAPIIAIINNQRHEIRLSGPPPEVKIQPDPAYELTCALRHLQEGQNVAAEKAKPKPIPVNETPFDLIKRLKEKGFLNSDKKQEKEKKEEKPKPRFTVMPYKESTPPIPSEHTFDSIERKLAPSTSLRDFNMRLLKVRYSAIVESLHEKQRNACPHCGMRMELSGEKYERHMDWHVKRNLQTLEKSSTSRPWFSTGKDWLTSEDESLAGPSQAADIKEEVTGPAPAVNSSDVENKECSVCGEAFEEFYDEEEEMWRLRNTIVVQDKACHVGCAQDVSMVESLPSNDNSPLVSDTNCVIEDKPLKLVTPAN